MTTKPPRFGDAPSPAGGGERRMAPLPLATQPMIPLEPAEQGTQLSLATQLARQTSVSAPFPKPPVLPAHMVPTGPAGPPPEISLSQHHLPAEPADRRLTLLIAPDSERAAAFRVMRHHLLELGRPQVILVSSPGYSEGKTTVAANLALALAECGRAKVLLIETHVRRPQLADLFRLTPPWCFAEQLAAHRHQPMLPWSLTEIPQLWLHVAAINPRIEKTQLLDAPAFAIAMERLRIAGYDHIVIDAPPVLGSADVNLMADGADAVVLAIRARRSTARDLRRAVEQVGASKVVGTVIVND